MIRAKLLELSQHYAGLSMEETLQQDSESKNPNEDQGGIRRRLRDRDLLKKRKAEAEEKETNQLESQRKRSRPADKSSSKRRGRPKKTEATPQIVAQGEAALTQEAPAAAAVLEPAAVIPDQIPNTSLTSFTTTKEESKPVFGSGQGLIFGPFQTPVSAPVSQALDVAPVRDSAPDPVPALSQESVRAEAPAPVQVESLYTGSKGKEKPGQILIEDLGPDEEEDITPSQDDTAEEDLSETLSISEPEQTKMYSVPVLSSPPVQQEYFPGN
ncbi:uncharacterized protein hemgn isoform X2 [Salarias fasciatus]|uniref:uncharacterized protein hemgn isoform X2 n=1 Tax=Salarias fasciatus TaxID=181472 RepID=UPI0011765CE2|nr:hemogen isoform X2 [Salarias fasciatus]